MHTHVHTHARTHRHTHGKRLEDESQWENWRGVPERRAPHQAYVGSESRGGLGTQIFRSLPECSRLNLLGEQQNDSSTNSNARKISSLQISRNSLRLSIHSKGAREISNVLKRRPDTERGKETNRNEHQPVWLTKLRTAWGMGAAVDA